MQSQMIGLLTETAMHPGASQSAGAIDLPVQRERSTGYPVIVGSSLKGSLRDYFESIWGKGERVDNLFGKRDEVGHVSITDGRLLLLPVRSLQHAFVWITCPYLLERFQRDLLLSGRKVSWSVPGVSSSQVIIAGLSENSTLFLEEFAFTVHNHPELKEIAQDIAPLMAHHSARARLADQLAIIHDKDFGYFAQYGLPVNARNQLDNNKISQNLWYEETLPADTLLYYLALAVENDSLTPFIEQISASPYIQLGGNASIGQGYCIQNPWKNQSKEELS
ncbi:type III-B CRISPR module RAMP protein Cmr4 [Sulfobacillus thermosulfidooxidans]|uniref:type III-B CRISPR module RAMP protein Cmr4 n=1 Tax=Sulfobacillus thermosulfidooxidans TaxID=28034 RepID=UPI0009E9B252|nr:type III-B CRISPR module RAMP protein Cmr4 [Sulfobacillus thermosulfidooxidans]